MKRSITLCVAGVAIACATAVMVRQFEGRPAAISMAPADRVVRLALTTREGLASTVATLDARVSANPADEPAAVGLADALMRQARVEGDASLPRRAEAVLARTVEATDGYQARRMLGAVLLAQHRFHEALEAGRRAGHRQPDDPWNFGVIGDAAMELGRYDEAFAAFDRMAALKPTAAAYARIAYARELQGDLDGATSAMRMAVEATSPHDPEAQAWAWSQLGALALHSGHLDQADQAFNRALHVFPRHPYALTGQARLSAMRGDLAQALTRYRQLLETTPTPELSAQIGDILQVQGDRAGAEAAWAEAERLERDGWKDEAPQPAALARLLAERGLSTAAAVALARQASATRDDIYTNDALAWALFRSGAFDDAWAASERARRTGTRDRRILYHAAAIAEARGDTAHAWALAARALDGHPTFDVIAAPAARALLP